MNFDPPGARFWMLFESPEPVFWFGETCVKRFRLKNLLWWLGRRGADQEDLIICVAFLVAQTLWPPLLFDDLRARSMASQNKLHFKTLFGRIFKDLGAILESLGEPKWTPKSILGKFLCDAFLQCVLWSIWGRFGEAGNQTNHEKNIVFFNGFL